LPVLVTGPGRSTAYAYDPGGNLLQQTLVHTASTLKVQTWS
jgi:YD repeat-containing protein